MKDWINKWIANTIVFAITVPLDCAFTIHIYNTSLNILIGMHLYAFSCHVNWTFNNRIILATTHYFIIPFIHHLIAICIGCWLWWLVMPSSLLSQRGESQPSIKQTRVECFFVFLSIFYCFGFIFLFDFRVLMIFLLYAWFSSNDA